MSCAAHPQRYRLSACTPQSQEKSLALAKVAVTVGFGVEIASTVPLSLRMAKLPSSPPMHCPNCGAEYKIIRIEAPPSGERPLECLSCGGPLPAREGAFILKYFLVGKLGHRQKRSP
jgi:predicted RNA-binding Zn-ribbon protein involved in translation (DUF1610 family)